MSAAAALRSACRALGRPSSFPHGLLEKPRFSPPVVENIIPRRLYSSFEQKQIIPTLDRMSQKADKLDELYDKTLVSLEELKQMMQENIKRARRRKLLVRGCILIGVAIFAKKHFFGKSQEDD